jgi:hypothetical protein
MKKCFYLVLIFVFSTIGLSAQKYLNGKVKVVDVFPDYKVRVVKAFPDLKVKVVKTFPDSPGEWQFVDTFEDFSIQYVDAFEDFTIQFVDAFPGPTSSQNTTRNAPEKIVATTNDLTIQTQKTEPIFIYSATGHLLFHDFSPKKEIHIPASSNQLYIIRVGEKVYKFIK